MFIVLHFTTNIKSIIKNQNQNQVKAYEAASFIMPRQVMWHFSCFHVCILTTFPSVLCQIIIVGTYVIASGFFSVYSMGVDTVFLCFCELHITRVHDTYTQAHNPTHKHRHIHS